MHDIATIVGINPTLIGVPMTECGQRIELYGLTFNERVDMILGRGLTELETVRERAVYRLKMSPSMTLMNKLLDDMYRESAHLFTRRLIEDRDFYKGADWSTDNDRWCYSNPKMDNIKWNKLGAGRS